MGPRYKASHISRASGLPLKKLSRLIDRGIISPSAQDIETPGSGRPRYFSTASARKIAIAHQLMTLGVPPKPAGAIAERHNYASGLLVVDKDGRTSIQNQADFQLGRGAIVLNLSQISADVDERLAQTA